MEVSPATRTRVSRLFATYARVVTFLAYVLLAFSMVGVLAMIVITCADVIFRIFDFSIPGAFDLVRISGTITIACALPYTTAVKGHVAIEYFFHKLSRRGRIVVDTLARLAAIVLFAFLARESFLYGESFRESGQVTQTIEIPEFWIPYVVAICCAVVVLVIIHNLLRPGREMIRP
jgi:TRAP-type C4-dicarboxylate transport system permease small subunit